jgi:hypothetical protein
MQASAREEATTASTSELVVALTYSRQLERTVRYADRPAAVLRTNWLLLAARRAGWPPDQLAAASSLSVRSVTNRISRARVVFRGQPDPPVPPAPEPSAPPTSPVGVEDDLPADFVGDDGEWLTVAQACRRAGGVHPTAVARWRRAGLLPHSRRTTSAAGGHPFEYWRPELDDLLAGPRYGTYGIRVRNRGRSVRDEK